MSFLKKLFGGKLTNSNVTWDEHGHPVWPGEGDYEDFEPQPSFDEKEVLETDESGLEGQKKPSQVRITGHDVLYFIPDDMKNIKVQIQQSNGRIKNEYTLTNYLDIQPGERLRLIVRK